MLRTGLVPTALLFAALASSGCAPVRRLGDCRDLAETVNPTLDAIARDVARAPRDAELYRAIAKRYALLAAALGQKTYVSPQLSKATSDYAKFFEDASSNTMAFAEAHANGDRRALKATSHASRQHVTRQRHYLRRLDAACRGE
jgi:hypothetical protein